MSGLTVAEVLQAVDAAEERLAVDLLQVVLFSDGSGRVMAPAQDWSDGGKRTDIDCDEEVFEFQDVAGLMAWLREGTLPEQQDRTPDALTCEDHEGTLA